MLTIQGFTPQESKAYINSFIHTMADEENEAIKKQKEQDQETQQAENNGS